MPQGGALTEGEAGERREGGRRRRRGRGGRGRGEGTAAQANGNGGAHDDESVAQADAADDTMAPPSTADEAAPAYVAPLAETPVAHVVEPHAAPVVDSAPEREAIAESIIEPVSTFTAPVVHASEPLTEVVPAPHVAAPAPRAPETVPLDLTLPPDSGLELIETRASTTAPVEEPATPAGPRRTRPPRAVVASEPLEFVETRKDGASPSP